MKAKSILILVTVLFLQTSYAQDKTKRKVEGPRWRIGLDFHYSTSFKNITIQYPGLGYNGVLGGFTGKGLSIFGGYKLHKYLVAEVELGGVLNNYNRSYTNGLTIIGRFNKLYIHPTVKIIYPIYKGDYRSVNIFVGGGFGVNGSGRFYLEERYDSNTRDITYVRYNQPMIAPFAVLGGELLLGDIGNIILGFKYQNGSYSAKKYSVSYDPSANLKNAPSELKSLNAQGIAFYLGVIREF